jgi:hypothetical protein
MIRTALRRTLLALGRVFRPTVRLYSWWFSLRLGRFGEAVVLPDSMAIFISLCVATFLLPYAMGLYFTLFIPFLLLSPFFLTAVVWVGRDDVRVVRVLLILPYWIHRVSVDATFDLFQAWEDRVPSGVVFEWRSLSRTQLHLGTATSASALYAHISAVLEREGWKRSAFGMERASNATNAL